MTLLASLQRAARTTPDAPFLTTISRNETLTYGRAAELAAAFSQLLEEKTESGDRVWFLAVNHWAFHPLLVACAATGRVLVPLNPNLHPDEIAFIGSDSTPTLVIFDETVARLEEAPSGAIAASLSEMIALADGLPEAKLSAEAGAGDLPALFVYTSGTTGSGKAVMLSEGNLVSMAETFIEHFEIRSDDRFLCVLPLYHMNGIMVTGVLPMIAGCQSFIADVFGFTNAKFYWDTVAANRVTIPSLVPSIMAMLAKLFPRGPGVDVSGVRFAFCGTAPLPEGLWRGFEERFGFPVFQGYGLTETTTWVTATPFDPDHRHDSVGVPFGAEVKIDATLATAKGHEEGEVLVKGPMVMSGYFNKKKLTHESFRGGYLKTGDIGFFDDDGELHITGRKKEIIIRNGVNINPIEIDRTLLEHPRVAECKTIGVEHEVLGEAITTVFVPEEAGCESDVVRDWVRERMSPFYVPDRAVAMPYLPKGPTGKVAQRELRGIVTGQTAADTLKKLTAWKYKRSKPSDPDAITRLLQEAYLSAAPIRFLTYWGCGNRDSLAEIDTTTLDRLAEYLRSAHLVAASPPQLLLMLNDMHSRVNEIPEPHFSKYYGEISDYAESLGFQVALQSRLFEQLGLNLAAIREEASSGAFDARWAEFPLQEQLERQAASHFRGGDPTVGARRYGLTCMVEGPAFADHFHDHVFLTYNGPDMDLCLPPLPKLYLYSYKKGKTVKPWFIG